MYAMTPADKRSTMKEGPEVSDLGTVYDQGHSTLSVMLWAGLRLFPPPGTAWPTADTP